MAERLHTADGRLHVRDCGVPSVQRLCGHAYKATSTAVLCRLALLETFGGARHAPESLDLSSFCTTTVSSQLQKLCSRCWQSSASACYIPARLRRSCWGMVGGW